MVRVIAILLAVSGPFAAKGQTLSGLRIEGPGEALENTITLYQVIAEFDNGWEFEVTLDSFVWTEPGIYADIGVFGDLASIEVIQDETETIHAVYSFGNDVQEASLAVSILNVPLAGFALDFDGVDDIAVIPRSADLEPTDAITVECWAKAKQGGATNAVMMRQAAGFDAGYVLRWNFQNTSRVHFQLATAGLGQEIWLVDPSLNTSYLDVWHHFAGVYSASGDFARLYVDGNLVAAEAGYGPLEYSASDLTLGRKGSSEAFHGELDDIRIWSVPRTRCEIVANMNRTLRGDEDGLVGYWKLDDGPSQTVADSSLLGNDGRLGSTSGAESNDPLSLISGAPIDLPPFDAPQWTTPALIAEISSGEDWSVSVSADQRSIYISSERDGFARSDIYRADRASLNVAFQTPVLVPEVSIPGFIQHEADPHISADGLRLYVMRVIGAGPGDFYLAERASPADLWDAPVAIESLNTVGNELGLAISGDELDMVLISDRSGPLRYLTASRAAITDPWSNFASVDSLVDHLPRSCSLSGDGLTLYITSEGPTGLGGYDVWRLARPSLMDPFGDPVHVPELSTATVEFDVSLTPDARTVYLVRRRSTNAGDIYVSNLVIPGEPPDGDLDCDGEVGLADFGLFHACFDGPGGQLSLDCVDVDRDGDGDVDIADFERLQNSF